MTDRKLSPEAERELAALSLALAHNPKTRAQFAGLVREIDPSKRFPDIEADNLRASVNQKFEEERLRNEQQRILQAQADQRAALIASGRLSEDDVRKMEKDVMEKHGIGDYDIAAKVYAADTRPASPKPEIQSRTWQLPVVKMEDLGNISQTTMDNAYKVVDEIRGRRTA